MCMYIYTCIDSDVWAVIVHFISLRFFFFNTNNVFTIHICLKRRQTLLNMFYLLIILFLFLFLFLLSFLLSFGIIVQYTFQYYQIIVRCFFILLAYFIYYGYKKNGKFMYL